MTIHQSRSPFLIPGISQHYSKLFIPTSSSELIQDEFGNWVMAGVIEQEYLVFFKRPRLRPAYLPTPGLDSSSVELSGYLVQPMFFPASFQPPDRVPCLLKTPNGEISGEFLIHLTPGSTVGADAITGQKITGVFTKGR